MDLRRGGALRHRRDKMKEIGGTRMSGPSRSGQEGKRAIHIALLTGCADKPYALGLGSALIAQRVDLDLIGGDDLESEVFRAPSVNFLNLRGDQRPNVSAAEKVRRVLAYYGQLIRYAATAQPEVFHILWNNKLEFIDRTLLMVYYKAVLGKKIVLTVHNVNAGKRDGNDSLLNRATLKIQYRLADHIFVHTQDMKAEMANDFGVASSAITVVPFGV